MKPFATHNWKKPKPTSSGTPQRPQASTKEEHATLEISAGGVVFRRRNNRSDFFFIKHGEGEDGKWTLPKGHQERGESLVETAIREIREETGLTDLRYLAPLGKTSFRFRAEGKLIEKHVYFFLFQAAPDAKEHLTGEEAIWEAIWVPMEKVLETCGYKNLERLLNKAMRIIRALDMRASGL
ncbi:MAG: NUDIX domain-containing protein [bacterium]|nr:NUDIX domain-containing protein [bacterium]